MYRRHGVCYEDREDYPEYPTTKVGGWPTHIQWQIEFCETRPNEEDIRKYGVSIMDIPIPNPAKPEFVFQVNSESDANMMFGDVGMIYFGRGTGNHKDEWFGLWECY